MLVSTRRRIVISLFSLAALISAGWLFLGFDTFRFGHPHVRVAQDATLHHVKANETLKSTISESDYHTMMGNSRLDMGDLQLIDNMPIPGSALDDSGSQYSTLGIADGIYVISLPRRVDRRATMERLRESLSLQWSYIPAVPSQDNAIQNIMNAVRSLREKAVADFQSETEDTFDWPSWDFDLVLTPGFSLGMTETDLWSLPFSNSQSGLPAGYDRLNTSETNLGLGMSDAVEFVDASLVKLPAVSPLTCATRNHTLGPPYDPSLPVYMLLTPAKIACWYSHVQVIRRIAEGDAISAKTVRGQGMRDSTYVAVVLEDDVDMERDVRQRLERLWEGLPSDWDILFLGHCWSNESYYPAIWSDSPASDSQALTKLHPSYAPKCTHAYALTSTGARKLLMHLRHPPFAYSRALDQALSWLVLSGRLNAFSVVPSLVVQRKVDGSDIDTSGSGTGSAWRERLQNGVLGT